MLSSLNADMFKQRYSNVSEGPKEWQAINTTDSDIYNWEANSTYVKRPPFFDDLPDQPEGFKPINDANNLRPLPRPSKFPMSYSEATYNTQIDNSLSSRCLPMSGS